MRYIAYFQSYTNTYRASAGELQAALRRGVGGGGKVVRLAVATRPDTLPAETVELLRDINRTRPVFVELGVETLHDTHCFLP